jgi:ubiquinone/menaquinone biosynthesis C-methylase UbiE
MGSTACRRKGPSAEPEHQGEYVRESAFGQWFLATDTWATHVLERALDDLERLIKNRRLSYPTIVDVGCGCGQSFKMLDRRFRPKRLVGIDLNPEMLAAAAHDAGQASLSIELHQTGASRVPVRDESVDMVFCHQTFHHLVDQEAALREFYRILKPGALLLFAESTRHYIESWIIRLLFRHPMHVQKTAPEYLQMIRVAGFAIDPSSISYPYLWWSRPSLGLLNGWTQSAPPRDDEQTLVNAVAVRL